MKNITLSVLILLLSNTILAQNSAPYQRAIGLRLPMDLGITYKHSLANNNAIEALAFFRYKGVVLTGLYEFNRDINQDFRWYFGGGAHIGAIKTFGGESFNNYTTFLGVDGIIGVEYTMPKHPFNFSIDWKPALNLIGVTKPSFETVSLSARYIF